MNLIHSYDMKLETPDCFPGTDWYRAVVNLKDDITDALPYLNAELEGADYDAQAKVLLWKAGGIKYAFRPDEIVIAPVQEREEARRTAGEIIQTVNDIWKRKDEIEPNYESRKPPPKVLDIYRILPKTNCKECGSPSCMAFAAALRNDTVKLTLCPYLSKQEYSELTS
ncbi:MAG: Fe-S cluster protein [Spirochaetes bacterium]|nr:Fe-S cluster protein [Spirochaetota bacterium]